MLSCIILIIRFKVKQQEKEMCNVAQQTTEP